MDCGSLVLHAALSLDTLGVVCGTCQLFSPLCGLFQTPLLICHPPSRLLFNSNTPQRKASMLDSWSPSDIQTDKVFREMANHQLGPFLQVRSRGQCVGYVLVGVLT